jgi:aspartate aminotransferase
MRKEFEKRRNFLFAELNKLPHINCFKPQGAFYIMPNISWYLENNNQNIENCDQFCQILLEKHYVALVSGTSFGLDTNLRFSYANSIENLEKGVARFGDFLEELIS